MICYIILIYTINRYHKYSKQKSKCIIIYRDLVYKNTNFVVFQVSSIITYNFTITELFLHSHTLVKPWDEMKIGPSKGILFYFFQYSHFFLISKFQDHVLCLF